MSFIGASGAVASGSTIIVGKPAGTVDGHVMYACITKSSAIPEGLTNPAGWTEVFTTTVSWDSGSGAQSTIVRVLTKVASSEGADYTWTGGANTTTGGGIILTYDDADPADLIDAVDILGDNNSNMTEVCPSITTTKDVTRLVCVSFSHEPSGTRTVESGMTQRFNGAAGGGHFVVADEFRPTAGATGTRTHDSTANNRNMGWSFAIPLIPSALIGWGAVPIG